MTVEWDAHKARTVLIERGIDFQDAAIALLEGPVVKLPSPRREEERYVGLVEIRSKVWAVVHIWRGEKLRIITVRRARQREERAYREIYAGRVEAPQKPD